MSMAQTNSEKVRLLTEKNTALTRRVRLLEERVQRVMMAEDRYSKARNDVVKRYHELEKRLNKYAKRKMDAQMDTVEARLKDIDRRELARTYRDTALTEVSWYLRNKQPDLLPQIQDGLIRLFDMPDRWWLSREKMTIADWIREVLSMDPKEPLKVKDPVE